MGTQCFATPTAFDQEGRGYTNQQTTTYIQGYIQVLWIFLLTHYQD